jgi:ABC-type proline/glycine betaine transport system ATPase subunit
MKSEGRTILFVTHDMSAVERFCDRAILIERGRIIADDDPTTIARKYNEVNFGRLGIAEGEETERFGDHRQAEITRAWFEDASGEQAATLAQNEPAVACFEVEFHEAAGNPIFEIAIRNEFGALVYATSSLYDNMRATGVFKTGQRAIVRVKFDNVLAPSRYLLSPAVRPSGSPDDLLDQRNDLATVIVHSNRLSGGVVDLDREFSVERA